MEAAQESDDIKDKNSASNSKVNQYVSPMRPVVISAVATPVKKDPSKVGRFSYCFYANVFNLKSSLQGTRLSTKMIESAFIFGIFFM